MLQLRLGNIAEFPFIDAPDPRAIRDGFQLLHELGAVDERQRITPVGRKMARFPVDPRLSRMLLAGAELGSLQEVLVITAALSIQDPRERPLDKRQAADEKHRQWQDPDSDFIGLLNLWQEAETQRQALSQNQFRRYCQKHFLSFVRMREWREIHRQLLLLCKELKLSLKQKDVKREADKSLQQTDPTAYEAIHKALLHGLLSHIGEQDEHKEFRGARNRRLVIFPGSALYKKPPKWLMAGELAETTQLYARMVARIDPAWVEPMAKHLVKRNHSDPHWSSKRGQVLAHEQVSLYGLAVAKHRVDFSKIDAAAARDVFIYQGLVAGELRSRLPFLQHNQQVIAKVEKLEDKSRRRDILVDDPMIYQFYAERLPQDICSTRSLEHWYRTESKQQPDLLRLDQAYLMQHSAEHVSEAQFPNTLEWQGQALRLSYRFEPGTQDDGVTLHLPLALLNQISAARLDWLVPGMLQDKCVALLKLLPKSTRKHFVPIPDTVTKIMAALKDEDRQRPLTEVLRQQLQQRSQLTIAEDIWRGIELDDHYRMNLRIIDNAGKTLGQGRDIEALRSEFGSRISQSLAQAQTQTSADERSGIKAWDFGSIAEPVAVQQSGMAVQAYTAVVDTGDSVSLELVDTEEKALMLSGEGVVRLAMLATAQQTKYLARNIPELKRVELLCASLTDRNSLADDIVKRVYQRTFIEDGGLPRTPAAFEALVEQRKNQLVGHMNEVAALILQIAELRHQVVAKLEGKVPLAWVTVYQDVQNQLDQLCHDGFLRTAPWQYLQHYPRYLQAILQRLDKVQNNLGREQQHCSELAELWEYYQQRNASLEALGRQEPALVHYRWMLEEYRVSLFAQQLGTAEPVSRKRLLKQLEQVKL